MKTRHGGRIGDALGSCVILAGLSAAAFSTTSLVSGALQDSLISRHAGLPLSLLPSSFSISSARGPTMYANLSSSSIIESQPHRLKTLPVKTTSASFRSIDSGEDLAIEIHQTLPTHTPLLNESQTLPNITQQSQPAFVLPGKGSHNETHGCKAWGPLCQTGSTVVGVREHNTIATTTVPCSSYLSAQAYTIWHDKVALSSWRSHFGRSPQCIAYAESEQNGDLDMKPDWLAICGEVALTMPDIDIYPPGIYEEGSLNETDSCCGPCTIFVSRVNLRYFPQDSDVPWGADIKEAESSMGTAPPTPIEVRTSLFVSNGFTYTSPSLYFEIMGTASFMDDCGQLGVKLVSSTLAIPPGVMSTVSFDVPVGAMLPRDARASKLRHLAPLKTRDLACPTWGVNMPVATDPAQEVKIAYPFYPLLVPPPELIAIDLAWSKCYKSHWPMRFGIFDPPRALTANSVMVGSSIMLPTPQAELSSVSANSPSLATSQLRPEPAAKPLSGVTKATPKAVYETASQLDQVESISNLPNLETSTQPLRDSDKVGKGYDDLVGSLEDGLKITTFPSVLSKAGPNENDLVNSSTDIQLEGSNFDETVRPTPVMRHTMIIGAATYTESVGCSCYSLAPNELLIPGTLITMANGPVVFLAPNGKTAVIDGTTKQVSPTSTGVAPAFAGDLNLAQVTQAGTGGNSSSNLSNEANISDTYLRATATVSANGFTLTAAFATGSSDLVVLGDAQGALTTLIPGGTGLTVGNGEVIDLGNNGVLEINGKPLTSLSPLVRPTRGRNIGAAVVTAFQLGIHKSKSHYLAETSKTPTANVNDDSILQSEQIRPLIP